jgi:hypothetical protein
MSARIFCDACDRDITEEARVSVHVLSNLLSSKDRDTLTMTINSKIKGANWDWCISCAQKRGIEIEER